MFINICSATEVGDDQPAGGNKLGIRPDWDPARKNEIFLWNDELTHFRISEL